MQSKPELRKFYKNQRKQLPQAEKHRTDSQIRTQIHQLLNKLNISSIGLYYPIYGEIDLLPLIEVANSQSIQTVFPVTNEDWSLQFFPVNNTNDFIRTGLYEIPEPDNTQAEVVPECLILPGLSFDLSGGRLGYGQGYYDTYLKNHPQLIKIGAAPKQAISAESLPKDPWDQPIDYLITESETIKINE